MTVAVLCGLILVCRLQDKKDKEPMKLTEWARGIKLQSRKDPAGFAYFWFYEWHLFDAVVKGEHTQGSWSWKWTVDDNGTLAQMHSPRLNMTIQSTDDGADMVLEITNATDYPWPDIAAIIPCFNPGASTKEEVQQNPIFLDEKHENTFFLGSEGLEPVQGRYPREIHFAHEFRPKIMAWEKERKDGNFVFSNKWPTSDRDAYAGLLVRESGDRTWVMGIAWESFLSAQAHNPWKCMHLSVRVGPLSKGEKKTIRGKMYLFQGSKTDCLRKFKNDFKRQ